MEIKNIENLKGQATRKINHAEEYSLFRPPVFVYKIPSIRSWNLFIKKTLTPPHSNYSVTVMEYLPELSCLLCGFESGLILGYIIQHDIFNDFYRDNSHSSAVTQICYVNDENTFFTAGLDNKIIVHNLKNKISSVFLELPNKIIKLTSVLDREYLVFSTTNEIKRINFDKILNHNNLENIDPSKITEGITNFLPKNFDFSEINDISNFFYFNTSFYHFVVLVYQENKLIISNISRNEKINMDYGIDNEQVFENLVVRDVSLIEVMPYNLLLVLTNDKNTKETFILKFYIYVENFSSNLTIRYEEKLDFINISSANKMIYCNDGKTVIIYSDDIASDSFILLNLQTGIKKQINIKAPEKLKSLAYINDHTNIIATGLNDGKIEIWTYLK